MIPARLPTAAPGFPGETIGQAELRRLEPIVTLVETYARAETGRRDVPVEVLTGICTRAPELMARTIHAVVGAPEVAALYTLQVRLVRSLGHVGVVSPTGADALRRATALVTANTALLLKEIGPA